ncbi:MAG: hypothetical protein ACLU6P_02750 [Roseburia intestinalis]
MAGQTYPEPSPYDRYILDQIVSALSAMRLRSSPERTEAVG